MNVKFEGFVLLESFEMLASDVNGLSSMQDWCAVNVLLVIDYNVKVMEKNLMFLPSLEDA